VSDAGGDAEGPRASRLRQTERGHDGPVCLTEALQAVARRIGMHEPAAVASIFGSWEILVGPALAAHVRPVRLDAGTLRVVVDHPAWAVEVRRIAPGLLDRFAEVCGPGSAPERIDVRVEPTR